MPNYLSPGVYVEEVEEVCRSAAELPADGDPWEALNTWFERFVAYLATKRVLAGELLNYLDRDAPVFKASREARWAAGEPLLKRAQEAGVVRPDADIGDVMHMVMGIAKVPTTDPEQTAHIVRIALDGLADPVPRLHAAAQHLYIAEAGIADENQRVPDSQPDGAELLVDALARAMNRQHGGLILAAKAGIAQCAADKR